MADAASAITSFLGGEISAFAQGGFDKPSYKLSLNVSINGFPVEIGPWVRRPGSMFAGTTRRGAAGRVLPFAFQQAAPYVVEITDGFFRAWSSLGAGLQRATTNDSVAVSSLSSQAIIQSFTSSGAFTVPLGVTSVNYLVVAGGGGGGGAALNANGGGGGGAGGLLSGTLAVTPGASLTVTIGAGGAGGVGLSVGANGGNSVFASITALGGGGGGFFKAGTSGASGSNGGSGGGESRTLTGFGSGTVGQGNNGGTGSTNNTPAGGGGGAGAVGGNATSTVGGTGGAGLSSSISGSSVTYAGGGGGGNFTGGTAGSGGAGGGGAGGAAPGNGTAGTANTGGGGGGGGATASVGGNGGAGGSGIVIISYAGTEATLASAVTWLTNDTGFFSNLGTPDAQLLDRTFILTKIDTTHFTLTDEITGAVLNFGLLQSFTTGTFNHIQEIAAPYIGGAWQTMRMVQAETTGILLQDVYPPQALTVTALPMGLSSAQFALSAASFQDGPYLDPPTNGVQVTPNSVSGIVQLSLSFQAWSPAISYPVGAFASSSGANYESLIDQNVGNPITVTFSGSGSPTISGTNSFAAGNKVAFFVTGGALPVALTPGQVYFVIASGLTSSAFEVSATLGGSAINMATAGTGTMTVALAPVQLTSAWVAVNASVAINNGQGLLATDIGRLIRLYSEPAPWSSTSTYATGTIVAYNPSNIPDQTTYWGSLTNSNLNKVPGTDTTNWALLAQGGTSSPALWSWGKITGLVSFIPGNVSGVAQIGNMTGNGGLSAAFNGTISQNAAASAEKTTGVQGGTGGASFTCYAGQNYSGGSPSSYAIASATLFAPTDNGIIQFAYTAPTAGTAVSYTAKAVLYGKATAPSSATDGTILGSTVFATGTGGAGGQVLPIGITAVPIASNSSTLYPYVWTAIEFSFTSNVAIASYQITAFAAQIEFVNATTGTSANGFNVEILGAPLLYTAAIRTWRLGLYSATTGYPTDGCYAGGRLWLGGAVANRFDACYANGILGNTINFAPTDQYGTVTDANALDFTLNDDGVNPIQWMKPVIQNTALRGIVMGSQAKEWFVFPPGQGGFSPTNIDAVPATHHGSLSVPPVQTEHTLIFVKSGGVKLMEYFSDVFSGKYTAPNLADKAQHITRTGIAEIAYTYATTPIIWGRCNDGSLFGCTYKRDTLMTAQGPTFYAWHRHTLGSGRQIVSLCAGPSFGGNLDALAMVTNQTNVSDPQFGVYHVETLTDTMDELTPPADAWYLDDAVTPAATTTTSSGGTYGHGALTLYGLWHLNGETVAVFAGGLDCGNFTVASGSIVIPYGDGASVGTAGGLFTATFAASGIQIVVGFDYNSDGQLVRPQEPATTGARNGPALGKKRRNQQIAALFNNAGVNTSGGGAGAISFGTDFSKLQPAYFRYANSSNYTPLQTFSGVWLSPILDQSDFDGMVCWRINRGYPTNIAALEAFIHTSDK